MQRKILSFIKKKLTAFRRNERGFAIVLFALGVVPIIGMFALSVDLGRQYRMDSELQEMADAAALAAAHELDGKADSIDRALAAVAALENSSRFADNDAVIAGIVFATEHSRLLTNPITGLDPDDQASAAWAMATTERGSSRAFFSQVVGGPDTMEAQRRATAGTQYVACAVQPLFMCLPSPASGVTLSPGMMIRVKEQPGSQWGPGNFGLLQPPNEGTNQAQITKRIKKNLAESTPPICYINRLLPSQGSKSGAVKEGINARFDLFANNPDDVVKIPPGPNNFKGMDAGGTCAKYNPLQNDYPAGRMPRDICFSEPNGCRGSDSPYGTGVWSAEAYWDFHHGEGTYPGGFSTRFAVYMAQMGLNANGEANGLPTPPRTGPEDPAPTCSNSKNYGPVGTWERRVIYAAMIDCAANAEWLKGNSAPSPISNADLGKFFLTEPTPQGQEIFLEFVEGITVNDESGKLQALVQLYPNP